MTNVMYLVDSLRFGKIPYTDLWLSFIHMHTISKKLTSLTLGDVVFNKCSAKSVVRLSIDAIFTTKIQTILMPTDFICAK